MHGQTQIKNGKYNFLPQIDSYEKRQLQMGQSQISFYNTRYVFKAINVSKGTL
jgi:hypothetical protein